MGTQSHPRRVSKPYRYARKVILFDDYYLDVYVFQNLIGMLGSLTGADTLLKRQHSFKTL